MCTCFLCKKKFNLIEDCKSFKVLPKLPIMENVTIKIRKPKFNSHTEKQAKYSKEGISLVSFCLFFKTESHGLELLKCVPSYCGIEIESFTPQCYQFIYRPDPTLELLRSSFAVQKGNPESCLVLGSCWSTRTECWHKASVPPPPSKAWPVVFMQTLVI